MLGVNALSGFGGIGVATPTISYIGNYSSTSSLKTYTFSSVPVGRVEAGRLIVVCVSASGATSIASATIDGASATVHVAGSGSVNCVSILSGVNSSKSSLDIAVTVTAAAATACGITVYSVYGLTSPTPTASLQISGATGGTDSGTMTTNANSIVIGCGDWTGTTTGALSSSGLTFVEDAEFTFGTLCMVSARVNYPVASGTSRTFTVTGGTGAANADGAFATWV